MRSMLVHIGIKGFTLILQCSNPILAIDVRRPINEKSAILKSNLCIGIPIERPLGQKSGVHLMKTAGKVKSLSANDRSEKCFQLNYLTAKKIQLNPAPLTPSPILTL